MKTFLSIIRNIPEPLKDFLKKKGAYKRYVQNCLSDKETLCNPSQSRAIESAFIWHKNNGGMFFWNKLYSEFFNRNWNAKIHN